MFKYTVKEVNSISFKYSQMNGQGLYDYTYNTLNSRQKGKCAICNKKSKSKMVIDHNHKTGKIRGLLCIQCNSGLGMFRDSRKVLSRAIKYL